MVGYICDKNKTKPDKKQKLRGLTVCHSPARKASNPLTVFSLPLGIAFLFVLYIMLEFPSELQGRNREDCNHPILFTIRNSCLFYGSHFFQVNWVDTTSHPPYAPKAGIRELETLQRPHLLPSRYVSRDMATKEPYVICV